MQVRVLFPRKQGTPPVSHHLALQSRCCSCRWRILLHCLPVSNLEYAPLIVMARCILHNMCIDDKTPFDTNRCAQTYALDRYVDRYGYLLTSGDPIRERYRTHSAEMNQMRTAIMNHLANAARYGVLLKLC
jgi:hypothetical protein